MPTNPVTPAQTLVRSNLASLSAGWRGLLIAERDGWTSLGASIVRTDSLGQTYTLTGIQAYMMINRNLHTIGLGSTSLAPSLPSTPALASATLSVSESGPYNVAFTATPLPAGAKLVVMATRPISPGVSFQPRGAYKIVAVSAATAASPVAFTTGYDAIYGPLLAGMKILVKVYMVDAQGFASPVIDLSTIVI